MGLAHSPRIVTDGLAFYYDASNAQKSWIGKPTTNYVYYPLAMLPNGSDTLSTWGNFGFSDDSVLSILKEPTALKIGNCVQVTKNTTSNGTVNTTGPTGNLNFGDTVTVSWYVKGVGGTIGKNIRIWAYNNSQDGSVSTGQDGLGPLTSEFQRFSYTYTWTKANSSYSGLTTYIRVDYGTGDRFIVSNPQIELGSVVSPFVNGTRSNTQSILDLTGKNTITASNLTYSNTGSFSFNGANNHIAIPSTVSTAKTVLAWIRCSAISENVIYGPQANGHDNWLAIASNRLSVFFTESVDVNNATLTCNTTINTNVWYHVACTIDTRDVRGYVNGNLDGTSVPAFNVAPWGGESSIGKRGNLSQRYFNGSIPYLCVYDRILTAAEIKQNFNATRGRFGV